MLQRCLLGAFTFVVALTATNASADEASASSTADLAKKLANPVSSLISVPFQLNYDDNIGPADDGDRVTLNIQPVVPVSLNDEWRLISRTILPVIDQDDIFPGSGSQSGIGDITQSVFFSPERPGESGVIWGAGPVLLVPTASDDQLGTEKWGAGPTLILLKQSGHVTYGALANHLWSFAGDGDRADVSSTFLQPFVSLTTTDAVTYGLNIEATYDWEADEAGIPLNASVSKVMMLGRQHASLGFSLRYWLDSTPTGPEGLGARLTFTLVFPR